MIIFLKNEKKIINLDKVRTITESQNEPVTKVYVTYDSGSSEYFCYTLEEFMKHLSTFCGTRDLLVKFDVNEIGDDFFYENL